jgi:GNAT superfamily N-acetyltransferase
VDITQALELQRRGIEAWLRSLASGEESKLFEANGVTAAIVPACPERSVVNSVVYMDSSGLGAAYADLLAAYAQAGVRAWTVWTPDNDREAISFLQRAGHSFDAEPAAMVLDLAWVPEPDPGDLDWDDHASPGEVGRVNDLAYGFTSSGLAPAIAGMTPGDDVRFYRARARGELASVLSIVDAGSDCVMAWVATLERFRGRGLARRLMLVALHEARERGMATSSLQATRMGLGVYERLGYRTACRLHMYERRVPP